MFQGDFQDFWDQHKIGAGDVLTFEKDMNDSNRIFIKNHQDGKGFEDLFFSKPKSRNKISHQQKDEKQPCSEQRMKRRLPETMANKSKPDSPWIENNGMFIKVIHLSNLVKMNCALPDWVHSKVSQDIFINSPLASATQFYVLPMYLCTDLLIRFMFFANNCRV